MEETRLRQNLDFISRVARESGVEIILALKAFALWKSFPIFKEYISHTTASSLYEARLSAEEFGCLTHTYSPAYDEATFGEILACSGHVTMNSLSQLARFAPYVKAAGHPVSLGLRINPEYSEIETELSIHAVDKRWRITQVPIDYRDRPEGSVSKLNTVSDGFKVLKMIASLFKDYKPLAFFTILSLISLIICLCLGIPVIGDYMATGLVKRFPTAILSMAFGLIAIMLFTCGLILDTIVKANRRQWELTVYGIEHRTREEKTLHGNDKAHDANGGAKASV